MAQSQSDEGLRTWFDLLDQLDAWGTDDVLTQAAVQARDLRDAAKETFSVTDSPVELHRQLLCHRKSLDSMEVIVATLVRAKSRLDQAVDAAQALIDDAESRAASQESSFRPDFASAQERNALLRGDSLEERITHRRLKKRREDVAAVLEYVRVLYRGLDQSRQDLNTRIRLITLSTSLER